MLSANQTTTQPARGVAERGRQRGLCKATSCLSTQPLSATANSTLHAPSNNLLQGKRHTVLQWLPCLLEGGLRGHVGRLGAELSPSPVKSWSTNCTHKCSSRSPCRAASCSLRAICSSRRIWKRDTTSACVRASPLSDLLPDLDFLKECGCSG